MEYHEIVRRYWPDASDQNIQEVLAVAAQRSRRAEVTVGKPPVEVQLGELDERAYEGNIAKIAQAAFQAQRNADGGQPADSDFVTIEVDEAGDVDAEPGAVDAGTTAGQRLDAGLAHARELAGVAADRARVGAASAREAARQYAPVVADRLRQGGSQLSAKYAELAKMMQSARAQKAAPKTGTRRRRRPNAGMRNPQRGGRAPSIKIE